MYYKYKKHFLPFKKGLNMKGRDPVRKRAKQKGTKCKAKHSSTKPKQEVGILQLQQLSPFFSMSSCQQVEEFHKRQDAEWTVLTWVQKPVFSKNC